MLHILNVKSFLSRSILILLNEKTFGGGGVSVLSQIFPFFVMCVVCVVCVYMFVAPHIVILDSQTSSRKGRLEQAERHLKFMNNEAVYIHTYVHTFIHVCVFASISQNPLPSSPHMHTTLLLYSFRRQKKPPGPGWFPSGADHHRS